MNSKIDVINLALANLANQNFIEADSEPTGEAIQAEKHWDVVLDCVLAEYPWRFATRTVRLARLGDDDGLATWEHRYVYPAACVMVRRVFLPGGGGRDEAFEVGRSADGVHRVINAGVNPAAAEYTTNAVPVPHMPPMFANALAWRLAAEIALAQRADAGLFQSCLQAYAAQADQARLLDARERGPVVRRLGSWLRSRA